MLRLGLAILALVACLIRPVAADQNQPVTDAVRLASTQNVTIGLITGGPGSTDAVIAGDIAQALDDTDKLRILPMLGRGSVQNIADLIYLKGVDVAIVHADVLTQTMQNGTIPRENTVQYIARLFPEEIHILARPEIVTLKDLNGKPVATGPLGGGTDMSAGALLDMSHVTPNIIHENQSAALDHLRHGDIAAMVVIGGKPVPVLQGITPGTTLHFLPIPLNAQLVDSYVPSSLDHQSYPNLVPSGPAVETVAVSSLLVTLSTSADTQRAKRVNRFVDTLFERFDRFGRPGFHPKWREVNLSAQVQGWGRYPEAFNLLRNPADTTLRPSFGTYLNQSGQTTSGMDNEQRAAVFRDFLRWRDQRSGQ